MCRFAEAAEITHVLSKVVRCTGWYYLAHFCIIDKSTILSVANQLKALIILISPTEPK